MLKFCSIEMSTAFKLTTPTTPREVTGGNIRAGGVISHQITLMSPLSCMAGMDQITKRLSCLDQWLVLQIHLMNPSPSRPLHMVTWVGAGLHRGYYPKVMTGHHKVTGRSNNLQIGENSLFLCCFNSAHLRCLWWLRVETDLDPSMEI